jgi:hypothetical protein
MVVELREQREILEEVRGFIKKTGPQVEANTTAIEKLEKLIENPPLQTVTNSG